jgi:hypothetical protein
MKTIYVKTIHVIAAAILIAACSTHRLRCQGTLQPINEPRTTATGPLEAPAAGSPEAPAEPQP